MKIQMATVEDRTSLLEIWARAVRATHHFLQESDIAFYLTVVRDEVLPTLAVWVAVDDEDRPLGLIGLSEAKIEMLFVDPDHHRQGVGRALMMQAKRLRCGTLWVDVNEDNVSAYRFYQRCGFSVIGRSALDGSGRPFPLLHLSDVPTTADSGG